MLGPPTELCWRRIKTRTGTRRGKQALRSDVLDTGGVRIEARVADPDPRLGSVTRISDSDQRYGPCRQGVEGDGAWCGTRGDSESDTSCASCARLALGPEGV